ncbi:MAG: hypothetical protein KAS66_05290 [Candidatus Omnitrophica bacterium]|nr:hypothetical protein [Candidatus Omnitrophota bacterium]
MKHKEVIANNGGIETSLHYEEEGDKLIVQNSADIGGLLDKNTEFRNGNLGKGKDMRKVASIPLHVLHELQTMWESMGIDPTEGMKKFLNDPDMKAFRTSNDRI